MLAYHGSNWPCWGRSGVPIRIGNLPALQRHDLASTSGLGWAARSLRQVTPSSGITLSIDLEIGEKEIKTWSELQKQAEELGVSIRLAACIPGQVKLWSVYRLSVDPTPPHLPTHYRSSKTGPLKGR